MGRKEGGLDGFSLNAKKRQHISAHLFFGNGETADLSTAYNDKTRKAEAINIGPSVTSDPYPQQGC